VIFEAMRNVVVGSLLILVLWIRPKGIIPELRKKFVDPRRKPVPERRPLEPAP
jgi:hypothetical protein